MNWGCIQSAVPKCITKKTIRLSNINLSSINSISTKSALIASWVRRIRTCSILTRSRSKELSNRSSSSIMSGICTNCEHRRRQEKRMTCLRILLASEGSDDVIRRLIVRQFAVNRSSKAARVHLLVIVYVYLAGLHTLRDISKISAGRQRE